MLRDLALASVILLGLAGAASAACPPNYVGEGLTSPGGTPITAAVHRDSVCTGGPCYWKSDWNNATGSAHCDAGAAPCSSEIFNYNDVGQYTSDDFVLTGPSGPSPVAFQALLHVVGSATNGDVSASITDGTQNAATGQAMTLNTTLTLNLSKLVGEHFHLDRALYARGYCSSRSSVSSQLELVLPPGYGATSCYGFSAAGPTPALPASWGHVKSTYRR